MKISAIALLVLFMWQGVAGQVSGRFTTSAGQPVQSVSVLLLRATDTVLIKAALSDKDGAWKMANIVPGKYILRVSSEGYRGFDEAVEFPANDTLLDLGVRVLDQSAKQLAQVVVQGKKPLFELNMFGTVVNVGANILSKGSTVLDLLQRSPGVLVNQQSKDIALDGKNGAIVMIDGKLLHMPMSQVLDLLGSMGAENIERIELMTNPPSKYDAEGSAGIINIVRKKNRGLGTNGSASLTGGYGYREKASANFSLFHDTKNIGLYTTYYYNHDRGYARMRAPGTESIPVLGGHTQFDFYSDIRPLQNSHNVTAGADIKLSPRTSISGNINYNYLTSSSTTHNYGTYLVSTPDSILTLDALLGGSKIGRAHV